MNRILLILSVSIVMLVACQPQTPIPVFVTPTQAIQPTSVDTIVPLVEPSSTPTSTETQPATVDPNVTPEPTATFLGAIVGPEYTLPPSSTPHPPTPPPPTNTPEPINTGQPTSTDAPTQAVTAPPTNTSAPGISATALPNLDANRIGLQLDTNLEQEQWNDVMRHMANLQVGWLKVQVSWEFYQPNHRDEVSVDLQRLELYLQAAANQGLQVLVSVAKAPAWARSTTTEAGPPDDPAALAYFINLFLREMGGSVTAIEIWNEPNLVREWQGQPLTGTSYMSYFAPAYDAVRAYSPNVIVVTAGLAPTGNNPGSADDRAYLQQMYNAGLANYTDVAIGVHPYGWGNPPDSLCCNFEPEPGWDDDPHFFFLNNIDDYRTIMVNNGQSANQLWPTEFGWATWDGFPGTAPEVWMTYNDKWDQANYTIRAFQIGLERDYMGPMFLWNLNFAVLGLVEQGDERAAYSLLVPDAPERPLYWMIYDALRPDIQLERYD